MDPKLLTQTTARLGTVTPATIVESTLEELGAEKAPKEGADTVGRYFHSCILRGIGPKI